MTNLEKYRGELDELVDLGRQLYSDLGSKKEKSTKFIIQYQDWYTPSIEVVRQIIPARLKEFCELYEGLSRKAINASTYAIRDWNLGVRAAINSYTGHKYYDDFAITSMRFQNQLTILGSAKRRFESSLFDIKQLVQADLYDSELDAAEGLNKAGFERAAGALTGVVIEAHLLQVCDNHNIKVAKKDPGINDLAQLLKDNDVIEIPEWRKIQHLADLRNLCDHKKKIDPTKEQIAELIDGAKKLTKTLF